jgi:hypothetical protein
MNDVRKNAHLEPIEEMNIKRRLKSSNDSLQILRRNVNEIRKSNQYNWISLMKNHLGGLWACWNER